MKTAWAGTGVKTACVLRGGVCWKLCTIWLETEGKAGPLQAAVGEVTRADDVEEFEFSPTLEAPGLKAMPCCFCWNSSCHWRKSCCCWSMMWYGVSSAALLHMVLGAVLEAWLLSTDGGPLYSWNLMILALDVLLDLGFLDLDLPLLWLCRLLMVFVVDNLGWALLAIGTGLW